MSERDDGFEYAVLVILAMAVVVMAIVFGVATSRDLHELRDLQRRIGELEQQVRR